MTDTLKVLAPDLGDIKDVPVIEVLAEVGAMVQINDTLVVLETEKATMDVPSTAAGKILEILVQVGDKINQGSVLIVLEAESSGSNAAPSRAPENAAEPATPAQPSPPDLPPPIPVASQTLHSTKPSSVPSAGTVPHASPSIRRFARELGVDLGRLTGTGPKGRILHSDVQGFVKASLAAPPQQAAPAGGSNGTSLNLLPWPQIDFSKYGPVERTTLSKIKKISAANLTRNSVLIPHVTNFDEADVTALEDFRVDVNKTARDKETKLTMLAFLIKASVTSLKLHPHFNASLVPEGDELILKRYFHIGFAADTPNGLVVPVIRDADTKGLVAIAAEAGVLAAQAREGKLKPADMQGGCFTISSLGGIGGTGFTPIINAPEVAILGAARAEMKPVWNGDSFAPRLILPLSLSWDHRVIDGAAAARFLVTLTALLQDMRKVLL